MLRFSAHKRCSYCNSISDLVIIKTIMGKKGFCGPVCAVNYEEKKMRLEAEYNERYNAPSQGGVKAITEDVKELERLMEHLKRIDYYSTITYTRRKRLTLERIREACEKMKLHLDALYYDSSFNAEDNISLTVGEVINQYYWTLLNLKKMIKTNVKETQDYIERIIEDLENEYPELKGESF